MEATRRVSARLRPRLSALALVLGACGSQSTSQGPRVESEPSPESEVGSVILESSSSVGETPVHLLEAGAADAPAVLLLHGAAFRATTWKELGTLELLARSGFRAIAIDLPGYGDSPRQELAGADFLEALRTTLGLERIAIVSPSMSGSYSLPYVAAHPEHVSAYVPIAPAAIDAFRESLRGSSVRTLVLWGSADTVFPVAGAAALAGLFQKAEVALLEGARHPCYLDQPERFHALLLAFLRQ